MGGDGRYNAVQKLKLLIMNFNFNHILNNKHTVEVCLAMDSSTTGFMAIFANAAAAADSWLDGRQFPILELIRRGASDCF